MQIGGAFLPRADKPLVAASVQGHLGTASAPGRMSRSFGHVENAVRQDVLAATDVEGEATDASGDDDFEPRGANRKKSEISPKNERGGGQER